MASRNIRWLGAGMTSAGLFVLLMTYAIALPEPAYARACCETCEANEAACYASCESSSHNGGDSLQACNDSCFYVLYEQASSCWRNCSYCQLDPGSECWSCLVDEHGSAPDYHHVYYCWETGGGFCAP
jgi:hypothetical protein